MPNKKVYKQPQTSKELDIKMGLLKKHCKACGQVIRQRHLRITGYCEVCAAQSNMNFGEAGRALLRGDMKTAWEKGKEAITGSLDMDQRRVVEAHLDKVAQSKTAQKAIKRKLRKEGLPEEYAEQLVMVKEK